MPIVLFIIFLMMVAYAILIGYYHRGWNHLPVYTTGEKTPTTFISVVIAARNEEKNIIDAYIPINYSFF